MNDTIEIYLELSQEIKKLLAQNNISENDILRRAGIDADVSYAESPFVTDENFKTRDIKTIIMVSAVSLSLIAPAFVKTINALKNDAEIARETWYELKPVTDPKTGEVLRDKNGEPFFNKVAHLELSQARLKETKEEIKLDTTKKGLSISFSTEEK